MLLNMTGIAGAETLSESDPATDTAIAVEADETVASEDAEDAETTEADEEEDPVSAAADAEEEAAELGATDSTPVITEIPGTISTEKEFNSKYNYVTGYASVDNAVNDRYEYVGTSAHRKVSTGKEFLQAILDAKNGEVKIIELTADIDLGYNALGLTSEELTKYSFLTKYPAPTANASMTSLTEYGGFTNPEMLESGVSKMSLQDIDGLTIFSKTGNSISHVETKINASASDIVIRNIHFKDMWQWDDDGKQKAVGWSNLKLNGGKNIWIDHCTFDVAFDGNTDIENGSNGISITWCKIGQDAFTDIESGSAIYTSINFMESLYQADKLSGGVYKTFRDKGVTPQEVMEYSAYHKKCHLSGSGDKDYVDYVDGNGNVTKDANSNIRLTLAYNHYINVGQRVPMIRQGTGHLINCFIDDSTHQEVLSLSSFSGAASDYKLSRCLNARNGACIAADTCVFKGIEEPITGAECQGDDLGNMSSPWTIYFKKAYNRSLIVNSQITNSKGTYTGSSWDNDGDNLFTAGFTWKDKSTINNWAWSSSIVGKENYSKTTPPTDENGNAFAFEFEYGTDEQLPYSYNTLPLDTVESVVTANAGCITDGSWTDVQWCTAYDPRTAIDKVAANETDTIYTQPSLNAKGKVEGYKFVNADADGTTATGGVITVNAPIKVYLPGMDWKLAGYVDSFVTDADSAQWLATTDAKADVNALKKYAKLKVEKKNNRTLLTTVANKKVAGGKYAVKLVNGEGDVLVVNTEVVEIHKDVKKYVIFRSFADVAPTAKNLLAESDDSISASVGLTVYGGNKTTISDVSKSDFNSNAIVWTVGSGKTAQTLSVGTVTTVTSKKGVDIAYLTVDESGDVKIMGGSEKGKVALTANLNGKAYKTNLNIR